MLSTKNLPIATAFLLSSVGQSLAAPIASSASLAIRGSMDDLSRREIDERSPRGPPGRGGQLAGIAHHAIKVVGQVGNNWAKNRGRRGRRDLEDLTARDIDSLYERDFVLDEREIDERSPRGPPGRGGRLAGIAHHAIKVVGQVGNNWAKNRGRRDLGDDDLVARNLENFDERDLDYIYTRYLGDLEDAEDLE